MFVLWWKMEMSQAGNFEEKPQYRVENESGNDATCLKKEKLKKERNLQ